VLDLLPPEPVALAAMLALVLLPGMLLVRAPWTAVPALSISFWVLAWWWVPLEGRTRQVAVSLSVFALLLVIRFLPKHVVPPPPGYEGSPPAPPVSGPTTGRPPRLFGAPSLLVLGLALAVLAPFGLWKNPPGREMAFQTTAVRLAVWRDALPATYEPLLPLRPYGVRGPALPTFAADVSLLSGISPPRALVATTLLAAGLVLLGLYALLGTRLGPGAAALGAVLGLAAVRWPGSLALWGEGGSLLSLALALEAAVLMVGHTSRTSAVGAGFLWAGAALAHPFLALAMAAATAFSAPVAARRWVVAFSFAAVLAAPPLLRLTGVLSIPEALGSIRSVSLAEMTDFLLGIALVVLCARLAALLLPSGSVADPGRTPAIRRVAVLGLALAGAAIFAFRVHGWFGAGQLTLAQRVDLARLERRTTPADVVCAPPDLVDWVPGLASRAVGAPAEVDSGVSRLRAERTPAGSGGFGRPWVPPSLREESTERPWPACTTELDVSGSR